MAAFHWSDELKATVIKMWLEGFSGTEIAHSISTAQKKFTRNSIISVIHRYGIKRGSPETARAMRPVIRKTPKPKPAPKLVLVESCETLQTPPEPPIVTNSVGYDLLELKADMCRAPVDERDGVHFFCGNPIVVTGKSYCAACAPRMSQVIPMRKHVRSERQEKRVWGRYGW